MFITKIGIDLGTANTLVFLPKKGVVVNEPTVVAVSIEDNRILAVGNQAKEMLGKAPETINVSRPMKDGVIADYRITEAMLRYFISKVLGRWRIIKPDIMVSVPAGVSSTERRAVIEATIKAGAKNAYIVKEPVLAAIGAGLAINKPAGNMIIDIGGGTSEMAVISLGGIVSCESVRVGGDKLDQAISEYIRKKHNLAIGDGTAERIKIKIGSALPQKEETTLKIQGRDLVGGLPKTIEVKSNEITEAMSENLREIIKTVKTVLRGTPPELVADIMDMGMVLSGGGALLRNLDALITEATGVNCRIAKEPLLCVAKGTGLALEHLDVYKRSIMSKKQM
ncbi:rod shape-determining protein [Patescibacteria group bacterium]|nr:rod shape-determining protein [Patescibacteria group bacterium]MBU2579403.1 rod shape-determining protein [Patescibacteria group bacterium]MBU4030601.1 rod shape-determining protein [Patescibacteria group bacterium]MBU4082616.1 rod shape-determining protein [Patescibacteria group bacterium]MCG2809127.1 rod shape-determining protein [Candidatus Portnoybacteria bacterium]